MLLHLTTTAGETFEAYSVGAANAKRCILIIHDWWGMLDYNKEFANHFKRLGYKAMVIDLYNGHHPENTKEAGEFMRSIDQAVASRKVLAALEHLKRPNRKIAMLGWSFGGVQAQHAALDYPDAVRAIVLYYCRIIFDKQNIQQLQTPVLGIFAEAERTWPDKQVALENLMAEFDKTLVCQSYDTDHGFANPDSVKFDDQATEHSRDITVEFLNKYLA